MKFSLRPVTASRRRKPKKQTSGIGLNHPLVKKLYQLVGADNVRVKEGSDTDLITVRKTKLSSGVLISGVVAIRSTGEISKHDSNLQVIDERGNVDLFRVNPKDYLSTCVKQFTEAQSKLEAAKLIANLLT